MQSDSSKIPQLTADFKPIQHSGSKLLGKVESLNDSNSLSKVKFSWQTLFIDKDLAIEELEHCILIVNDGFLQVLNVNWILKTTIHLKQFYLTFRDRYKWWPNGFEPKDTYKVFQFEEIIIFFTMEQTCLINTNNWEFSVINDNYTLDHFFKHFDRGSKEIIVNDKVFKINKEFLRLIESGKMPSVIIQLDKANSNYSTNRLLYINKQNNLFYFVYDGNILEVNEETFNEITVLGRRFWGFKYIDFPYLYFITNTHNIIKEEIRYYCDDEPPGLIVWDINKRKIIRKIENILNLSHCNEMSQIEVFNKKNSKQLYFYFSENGVSGDPNIEYIGLIDLVELTSKKIYEFDTPNYPHHKFNLIEELNLLYTKSYIDYGKIESNTTVLSFIELETGKRIDETYLKKNKIDFLLSNEILTSNKGIYALEENEDRRTFGNDNNFYNEIQRSFIRKIEYPTFKESAKYIFTLGTKYTDKFRIVKFLGQSDKRPTPTLNNYWRICLKEPDLNPLNGYQEIKVETRFKGKTEEQTLAETVEVLLNPQKETEFYTNLENQETVLHIRGKAIVFKSNEKLPEGTPYLIGRPKNPVIQFVNNSKIYFYNYEVKQILMTANIFGDAVIFESPELNSKDPIFEAHKFYTKHPEKFDLVINNQIASDHSRQIYFEENFDENILNIVFKDNNRPEPPDREINKTIDTFNRTIKPIMSSEIKKLNQQNH
jgi:hypothetical protein